MAAAAMAVVARAYSAPPMPKIEREFPWTIEWGPTVYSWDLQPGVDQIRDAMRDANFEQLLAEVPATPKELMSATEVFYRQEERDMLMRKDFKEVLARIDQELHAPLKRQLLQGRY